MIGRCEWDGRETEAKSNGTSIRCWTYDLDI